MDNDKYKYCSECGDKLFLGDRFCTACGAKQPEIENLEPVVFSEPELKCEFEAKIELKPECKAENQCEPKVEPQLNAKFVSNTDSKIRKEKFQTENTPILNFERKTRNKALIAALIGLFVVLSPSIFNIDGMDGGYAISLVGLLICLTGLMSAFVIQVTRVKVLDSIICSKNQLVYWKYTPLEWKKFKQAQYSEAKETNKGILIFMIIIITVVFAPFIIFLEEKGIMFIIYLVIVTILAVAAVLSTAHYKKISKDGFIIVTTEGLLMNNELHSWTGLGSSLKYVGYNGEDISLIEITYNVWYYKRTQSICTVVFPVPKGEEGTALKLIEQLSKRIN